jgi:hypothetical protein
MWNASPMACAFPKSPTNPVKGVVCECPVDSVRVSDIPDEHVRTLWYRAGGMASVE